MNPEISVVIPLFNKERYIRRAINSVLSQRFQNFECIIVDSSTDGSTGIVKEIPDPRIIHISCEKSTAARARNVGVQAAQSDLVAFLDADDEWRPDHLATIISLKNRFPDAGIFSTCYVKIMKNGKPQIMLFVGIPPPPWEGYLKDYLLICSRGDEPVHSSSCAISHKVFSAFGGFPENLKYGEDQFLWGKIALSYPVVFSWKGLAIYHTDAEGRICDEARYVQEHPFSEYLKQEIAHGRISAIKESQYRAYIRRKYYSELFSRLLNGRIFSTRARSEDENYHGNESDRKKVHLMIISHTLSGFYQSSVHNLIRRCLSLVYQCYDPGHLLNQGKNG